MKKKRLGVTLIELMVVVGLLGIMMAIATFGYKNYEARYRCQSAAQMLSMDLRLQQERARRFDSEQGILFKTPYQYSLGTCNGLGPASFTENIPPRRVDLTQQFYGVSVQSIGGVPEPYTNQYVKFDPAQYEAGVWKPMTGFSGDIVVQGSNRQVRIRIDGNTREISVQQL